MTLLVLCASWIAGAVAGSWSDAQVHGLLGLAPLVLGLGLVWSPRTRPWALPLVAAGIAVLGAARYQAYAEAVVTRDPFAGLKDRGPVAVRGTVTSDPEARDVSLRWRLAVDEIKHADSGDWEPVYGLVLVYHRWLAGVGYGDRLEMHGRLEAAPQFEAFDYRAHLARQGVHAVMRYPSLHTLGRDGGSPVLAAIYGLRSGLAGSLREHITEPEGAISAGVLLGIRSAIPADIEDEFRRTGTTHVLAVSGQNLTILVGLLGLLGPRLVGRRHWAYLSLGLLAVWTYAALVGFPASIVRAAAMATLVFLARQSGRQDNSLAFLALAAAVMVLAEPGVIFDLGFVLSVAAMAGIVLVPPVLAKAARLGVGQWEAPGALRTLGEWSAATVGAALFTLPVLASEFRLVPLAALPATLFALPALPVILFGSLATGVVAALAPVLAGVPAAITWGACRYLVGVVEAWSLLPGASVETPPVDPLGAVGYLMALLALLWAMDRLLPLRTPAPSAGVRSARASFLPAVLHDHRAVMVGVAAAAAVAPWIAFAREDPETVLVRFLDVGQGDAILITTGGGHRVLVDGGPSPAALLRHLGGLFPPWDGGFDLLVLTHPQRDHISGLLEVIERHPVGAVLEGPAGAGTPEYARWEASIERAGIPRVRAGRGARVRVGPATLAALHPPSDHSLIQHDVNNRSLVLRLYAHGSSLLLTGDVEAVGEEALLRGPYTLASTVLKVSHHGSRTSTSQAFLDAVSPRAAVISVGGGNSFGHPSSAVLDRLGGRPVLRTDLDGSVELRVTPGRAVLKGERFREQVVR